MPTASIDFTLAAIAIILIAVGSIYGVNMAAEPYTEPELDEERYHQIGRYMLLSQGEPANWGTGATPTVLGLASGGDPYELDIDKVTRLNPSNAYAVDYSTLWKALGIEDLSFNIEADCLFSLSLDLSSSEVQGGDTLYGFDVSTTRDGYPIPSDLRYYSVVGNSTYTKTGATDGEGSGSVEFSLPNSLSGTALLVGFARAEESIFTYGVLPFAHNTGAPAAGGTYATLSPNDYTLDVELYENNTLTKAAYFSHEYGFEDPGWLQGWDQRVPITVDHSDVDSPLTDFPLLVHLSDNSGRKGDNVTFVFDELGVDANRLKIAVTTSDGATQCYVEVEEWDDANEEAWLWVKVPSVNNTSDTELYLYYDADHADNTDYVGDPNSTPAEAVWDNDFRLVSHMRDDLDASHVRDSTGFDNDGTKTAPGEPVVTTSGSVSDAQDFDGSDDYVDLGSDTSLDLRSTDFTIEVWIYPTTQTVRWPTIYVVGVWELSFGIGQDSNPNKLEVWIDDRDSYASDGTVTYNEWNYVVLSWNGSNYNFYIDGKTSGSRSGSSYPDTGTTYIGGIPGQGESFFNGTIDEVRTSNTSRSPSWIKASYESEIDNLIDFGSEESREAQDSIDYPIPHLVDGGPIVLVITGTNTTHYWAEWAAYPQVPLSLGADMSDDYVVSDVAHTTYVVEVNGCLYRFEIRFRRPVEDD